MFRLSGFFSRPQVQKANRNSIYIFVNGRLIRDRLLMHALSSAYHNLIPPASYPFALLFLECDAEEVDVNVHPSKTEVRFRHGSFVHDFVRDTLRERLMESRPAPSFTPGAVRSRLRPRRKPARDWRIPNSARCSRTNRARPLLSTQPEITAPPAFPALPALPEFTLRATEPPSPRLDFSAPPIAGDARSAAIGQAFAAPGRARRISRRRDSRARDLAHRLFPICARWGRFTRASSSRPGATASGLSISMWRTSAFCSSK